MIVRALEFRDENSESWIPARMRVGFWHWGARPEGRAYRAWLVGVLSRFPDFFVVVSVDASGVDDEGGVLEDEVVVDGFVVGDEDGCVD